MRLAEHATGMVKNARRILDNTCRNILFGRPREEDIILKWTVIK
jgi:hypothetical protein